jgi:Type II secretion system (T2SS), protein M subtype b
MIATWLQKPRMRRAVFLGSTAAVGIVVLGLLAPIHDVFAARDQRVAEQRALLAHLSAVAAQQPTVAELVRKTGSKMGGDGFLSGPNEGIIGADLQTRLKIIIEGGGAQLRSVQNIPAKTSEQIRYVGARIEMSGSLQAVQRAVHAVETGTPFLFVTSAIIRPTLSAGRQDTEPTVDAQLEIVGAVQTDGASP